MTKDINREEWQRTIQDLEKRLKAAEERTAGLEVEARHLKAIIDNTNLPIYLKDRDYRYLLVNSEYERLAQVNDMEIRGKEDFDIFPEPVAQLFRSQDLEVKSKNKLVEFIETIPLADGIHTFITAKFPLTNPEGEIYAIGGVCTDVTALRQTEEALRRSEEKFKSVVESCPMGIFIYELTGDNHLLLRGTNPAASAILGIDCSGLIGKTAEEAFPSLGGTGILDKFYLAATADRSWHTEQVEYRDHRLEGFYEVSVFQTAPGMIAVMFIEITKRRLMEQELQKVQKLESIGILAGGIAHDFNNLLTVITGNLSLARIFADQGNQPLQEKLLHAEKASVQAQGLTQQLLTFAKGGAPVRRAAFISELIKDSASFVLSGSKVSLKLNLDDNLHPVLIDEGQLSQVIQNLIKNAEQAMPLGGKVTIGADNLQIVKEELPPLPPGAYVRISISDQGPGIHEPDLPRIFDPYFTTKPEGNGLGLAVAYSIIRNHNGFLAVESKTGKGSIFRIYLPATEQHPLTLNRPSPISRKSGFRILVMDDQTAILQVAVEMLDFLGYETATAKDGAGAVALFQEALEARRPFDLVMLDLTIPGGMGGRETLEKLRELDPGVKAIVASGYATDPIMSNFAEFGFSGVISKPYNLENLGAALNHGDDGLTDSEIRTSSGFGGEFLLLGPANRADPVIGQILEGRAGRDAAVGISQGWVIDVAADTTNIFSHFNSSRI